MDSTMVAVTPEGRLQADAELVAEAVAQRCSEGVKKDGSPKAPSRHAIIWQAARLGALEYAKMVSADDSAPAPQDREPWPGCYADLQQRRVTTLAKLGLMLSIMAGGEAAEVVGYDAADLYAEVLMALAIEDADDTDIALEEALDHPDGDILARHRIQSEGRTGAGEALATVNAILEAAPELNPSNYDHDQVCELSAAMVEACLFSRAALSQSTAGEDGA